MIWLLTIGHKCILNPVTIFCVIESHIREYLSIVYFLSIFTCSVFVASMNDICDFSCVHECCKIKKSSQSKQSKWGIEIIHFNIETCFFFIKYFNIVKNSLPVFV